LKVEDMSKPVELSIEDSIDLHSFQPREVGSLVEEYLYQACRKGYREVRIIHGRGRGVQRAIVQSLLKRHPLVAAFKDAPDLGATVVRLKDGD
jgi:dsDNA-specific endonuclease/ATPase MutS2